MNDAVDEVIERWQAIRPDLDTSPIGVVVRIFRASRLLEQGIKDYFEANGLESWEYDVLATLLRAGDSSTLRMGDLAGAAMISPGALTNRIDRLAAKGLVTRATDPDNRRLVRTSLTDEGRRLADGLIEGHLANELSLIEALTPEERELLTGVLRKLLLSLGDHG
ncbi:MULTISPECIES: MarR family winged helix-turn-helix transcriptional regulator [Streptomycetaceae]|uniref:MarR family winged helix-turn-helix transcriptional regulator n=1 Tax=Streptomycetaceae TaxID=2062 RepID=UPI000CDC129A|nr:MULTISPECIES: MarR family transcriptional regulator [Streptomycetaceae]AUY50382.1 MarR family transcriptional regulator [Streptomyces sp. CB01881]MBP0451886.1 MarR family transcriptional regulator [Kitasatospora sp. RG8]TYC73768.1 MarR family transcriptional regulator [Streptomyces sp. CB01881]